MKIYLFILLALLLSCSDITPLQSSKVYSIEEVKTVGIKIKGKFKTNFDLNIPSYSNFDLEVEKYCSWTKS